MIRRESYSIDCTGDVAIGDAILWGEEVRKGGRGARKGRRKGKVIGHRLVAALVMDDRLEPTRGPGEHVYRLFVVACDGVRPIPAQTTIYRQTPDLTKAIRRRPWLNEEDRERVRAKFAVSREDIKGP